MTKPKCILGIDPGTSILGFGIIEIKDKKPVVIDLNVINLKSQDSHQDKLREIFLSVQELIELHHPQYLAIESPFFGKNAQSMHKLGRAQGVAIAAAIVMGLEIHEFSPKKIKKAVTGNGNASKEQVAKMLESVLNFKLDIKYYDATDALAAALCLFYQNKENTRNSSRSSGWNSFIKKNPDRLAKLD